MTLTVATPPLSPRDGGGSIPSSARNRSHHYFLEGGGRGDSAHHHHHQQQHLLSLDYELRNAPSYHAAIMRILLPTSPLQRQTTAALHHHHHPFGPSYSSFTSPPAGHPDASSFAAVSSDQQQQRRPCLCGVLKDRKRYRKDWRPNDPTAERVLFIPPPPRQHHLHPDHLHVPRTRLWRFSFHSPPTCTNSSSTTNLAIPGHVFQKSADLFLPPPPPHHFRSRTVYLQVKLAELLSQQKPPPHERRTPEDAAAADIWCYWKLLEELSKMKSPFSRLLHSIHGELDRCMHSTYVGVKHGDDDGQSGEGDTAAFQRIPYFELVTKLWGRKSEILNERQSLQAQNCARRADVAAAQQQIQELVGELLAREARGKDLESRLRAVLEALQSRIAQVRPLQEESQNLKAKLHKARVEQMRAHQIQCDQMARQERYAKLEENYRMMEKDLQGAQAQLEAVRQQVADSVPKGELEAARGKVAELKTRLAELEAEAAEVADSADQLTPRPKWGSEEEVEELLDLLRMSGHGDNVLQSVVSGHMSTAQLLAHVCKQNISLTHAIASLQQNLAQRNTKLSSTMDDDEPKASPRKIGSPRNNNSPSPRSNSSPSPRQLAKSNVNETKTNVKRHQKKSTKKK